MSSAITTEALLESPKVFGISTITNAQRAWCRALDGLPLGDLVYDPECCASSEAPSRTSVHRRVKLTLIPAIRSLKTKTARPSRSCASKP